MANAAVATTASATAKASAVHLDRVRTRQLRGRECHHQPHHAIGDGDAKDRTRGRDDRRVAQRQEQQAPRSRAQRHPHGQFLPFGEPQREEQGADVDDRHEHHERACHQQQANDGTHVAEQVVVEGFGRRGHAAQKRGQQRVVAPEIIRELGRGLFDRCARHEPSDQVHVEVWRAGLRDGAERTRRRPHVRLVGNCKAARHHRDDRAGLPSNREHATQHRRIPPIATLPQLVTDRDHGRRGNAVILGLEVTAKQGRDAEHAEQIPGDQRDLEVHAVRSLAHGKRGRAVIVDSGDGGKRPRRAVHESLERGVRDWHLPRAGGLIDAPEHRQLPLLMHGQGPHEHGIGDAEGCRGSANADPEGRNCDETEGRPLRGRA
jgi:hypothetical protein